MRFAQLFWLVLIVVIVPLCVWLVRWGTRRKRESLDRIIAPRLHEQLLRSVDYRKRNFRAALFVLAMALLLVSIARPLFGYREIQVERSGVDMIFALDVSKSMLADDEPTNRLASAKAAITRLLDRPSGDRVGLIVFAGEPFLIAPVTQDHNAVRRTVSAVSTTAISKPGSDMAEALKLAVRSFDEKQQSGKAIVILSDGEELQGDAIVAAREVARKGISIFTIGVGSLNGARLAERAPGALRFARNEFGQDVVSRLNERVLQQVAASARGFYAPLGKEGEGLFHVNERGLAPLARGTQTRQSKDMREFFQIPLALCVLLLLGEMLVTERKKA